MRPMRSLLMKRLIFKINKLLLEKAINLTYAQLHKYFDNVLRLSGSIGVFYDCCDFIHGATLHHYFCSGLLNIKEHNLSFHDCNEDIIKRLCLKSAIKNWELPIINGLPQKFYDEMITHMIRYREDSGFAGAYDYNPLFYVRLREVMSWEEIAEYFGFTKHVKLNMYSAPLGSSIPMQYYAESQYYKDYHGLVGGIMPPFGHKINKPHYDYSGIINAYNGTSGINDLTQNPSHLTGIQLLEGDGYKYTKITFDSFKTIHNLDQYSDELYVACHNEVTYYVQLYGAIILSRKPVITELIQIIMAYISYPQYNEEEID